MSGSVLQVADGAQGQPLDQKGMFNVGASHTSHIGHVNVIAPVRTSELQRELERAIGEAKRTPQPNEPHRGKRNTTKAKHQAQRGKHSSYHT